MGLQATYSSDQLQARPHGSLGVVLMGLRVAEINQHTVAHVLRYEPAEPLHSLGDAFLVASTCGATVGVATGGGVNERADEDAAAVLSRLAISRSNWRR